MIIEGAE
jgi:hypothetical protein